jgi:hypothetical protein
MNIDPEMIQEIDRLRAIIDAVTDAVYVRHVEADGTERWTAVAPHEQTGSAVRKALEMASDIFKIDDWSKK